MKCTARAIGPALAIGLCHPCAPRAHTTHRQVCGGRKFLFYALLLTVSLLGLPLITHAQTVIATVTVGPFPTGVAVNSMTNKIYVANSGSNDVTVIDGASNSTITVTVGSTPFGMAVNPVTNKIYVANLNSNNVTVIDGASNSTTTVTVGNTPFGVAVNSMTNKIYVANSGSNDVTVIDGASNSTTTVAAGAFPRDVAVNTVTNKIYVANNGSNNVTVIDGASNSTTTVAAGFTPLAPAVNSMTNKIYVANLNSNNVTVIDGASNNTTLVTAGTNPFAVAVNSATNKIYVANNGSNDVTVIDGASNSTTPVTAGTFPFGVAVNSATNKIYVANNGSNDVTVIDGASNSTTTVTVGSTPFGIAVNSVTNKIYVANQSSNNVTVIDGAGSICGSAPSFADVVRNGVVPQVPTTQDRITATFQPSSGTLKEAACLGGYDHFNWVQVVTKDDVTSNPFFWPGLRVFGLTYCVPGYVGGAWIAINCATVPIAPYIDPPRGGWVYQGASALGPVEDNLNWYEDELYSVTFVLADHSKGLCTELENAEFADPHCSTTNSHLLSFEDIVKVSLAQQLFQLEVRFSTTLVGVRGDGTGDALNYRACQTGVNLTCPQDIPGTSFDWHAVGTVVGIIQTRSNVDPNSDSGTIVYFDGFKLPGVAGFSQPELELFSKNGINIREESGVIIPVIIDIKPGESPNSINPHSLGTIPVAIISTIGFHAPDQVDQSSLTFGRTGNESSLAFCNPEDVNDDGLMDLVCHFYTSKAGFQPSDTDGLLKGKALSGTSLYGRDSVRIISPR